MGDRYMPPRYRGGHRYAPDDDYDPYARYDRNERLPRGDRQDGRDRYGVYERYRSPPPRSPPRERYDGYGQADSGYTFRGAAAGDDYRRPPDQFSFRAPGPRFPSPDRYAPASRPPPKGRRDYVPRRGDHRRGPRGQPFNRGRRRAPPPSSREILHETGRARTPEQLEGMNTDGQVRFNALVSSSDESEDDRPVEGPTSSSEEEGEIRRKRFKVDAPAPKPEAPKWSNPDPYSALPPTENIGAPKKDIVQVIRKAKNDVASKPDMTQGAATNADFISFTFDDDMDSAPASIGGNDSGDHYYSDASIDRASAMNGSAPVNRAHSPSGSGVPSFQLRRSTDGDAAAASRPQSIGLTDSSDERPRKLQKRKLSPVDLTSDNDELRSPPSPPAGFVMPTDEELMQQYVGQPSGKKRKHNEQSRGRGDITEAWAANWTESTPWCLADRSQTADVSLRLHEEILDFYDFVRPHQHEEAVRQELIQRVQASVRGWNASARDVDIKCFGSFAAGLYLPTADMDLVAVSPRFMRSGQKIFCQRGQHMWQLVRHLVRMGVAQESSAAAVVHAKVPIIKFTDNKTGIKVDISFENDSGLRANGTFQHWKLQYPDMPIVVVIIKQLLAMRDLNEVFTGGLGGFSIICLVVSMLQHMSEDEWDDLIRSSQPYGELLLKFLDLYGNRFNTKSTGIVMDPPRLFDKINNPARTQNVNNLTIIDPNNSNNDISGGSREVHAVFEVFRRAHSQILQRMSKIQAGKDVRDSILGCVLGGNYSSFINLRNKLYKVYGGESVSPPPEAAQSGKPPPQKRKRGKTSDQGPPAKHQRSNNDEGQSLSTGPLASRVQGGPPTKKGQHPSEDSSTKPSTQPNKSKAKEKKKAASKANGGAGRQEKRKNELKAIHPELASKVGQRVSMEDVQRLGLTSKQQARLKDMSLLASSKKKKKEKKKTLGGTSDA